MDYLQKLNFLLWLFFTEIMTGKIVFRYSGKKTNIVRPKNWRFNKGQKNGRFFKGVSPCMLCPKIEVFLIGAFHRNSYLKTTFLILWKEKNDIKWKKFKFKKGLKNGHFPRGLVHGFCPKIEISRLGVFYRNYVWKNGF